MSFLLRDNRDADSASKATSRTTPGLFGTTTSRGLGKSSHIVSKRRPAVNSGLERRNRIGAGGQAQVMLQQQDQTQQEPQHSVVGNKSISMAEVMEDLRVLENQQRESQQKLVAIQTTKNARLQDMQNVDVKLEEVKYHNGQLRAQLSQARERLSLGTRELGMHRLEIDWTADSVKSFDHKLKGGITIARLIDTCWRKIQPYVALLSDKEASLRSLLGSKKNMLGKLQHEHAKVLQAEKKIGEDIRLFSNQVHRYAQTVTSHRNRNKLLEDELQDTREIERSTKLRVHRMGSSIQEEEERHERAVSSIDECAIKLSLEVQSSANIASKVQEEIKSDGDNLKQIVDKITKIEKETQLTLVSKKAGDESAFSLLSLQSLEDTLQKVKEKREKSDQQVVSLEKQLSNVSEEINCSTASTAQAQKSIKEICAQNELELSREAVRKRELEERSEKLASKKAAIGELKKSQELLQIEGDEAAARKQAELDQMTEAQKNQDAMCRSKIESIACVKALLDKEAIEWESIKSLELNKLESLNRRVKEAELKLKSTVEEGKVLHIKFESEIAEVKQKRQHEAHAQQKQQESAIAKLLEDDPCLQHVLAKIDDAECLDPDEQTKMALSSLQQECSNRLRSAEKARSLTVKKRDRERQEKEKRTKSTSSTCPTEPNAEADKVSNVLPTAQKLSSTSKVQGKDDVSKNPLYFLPDEQFSDSEGDEKLASPRILFRTSGPVKRGRRSNTTRSSNRQQNEETRDRRVHWDAAPLLPKEMELPDVTHVLPKFISTKPVLGKRKSAKRVNEMKRRLAKPSRRAAEHSQMVQDGLPETESASRSTQNKLPKNNDQVGTLKKMSSEKKLVPPLAADVNTIPRQRKKRSSSKTKSPADSRSAHRMERSRSKRSQITLDPASIPDHKAKKQKPTTASQTDTGGLRSEAAGSDILAQQTPKEVRKKVPMQSSKQTVQPQSRRKPGSESLNKKSSTPSKAPAVHDYSQNLKASASKARKDRNLSTNKVGTEIVARRRKKSSLSRSGGGKSKKSKLMVQDQYEFSF